MASLHPGVQIRKCEMTEQAGKKPEGLTAMKTGDKHWVIDPKACSRI